MMNQTKYHSDVKCVKCEGLFPRDHFYKSPKSKRGIDSTCKDCRRAKNRENYRDNIDRYREYDKNRAMLKHRVEARKQYKRTRKGKEAALRGHKKYWDKFPEKRIANYAVSNAIRDGKLERGPCEVCGELKAQAHHGDYSKPLDVRWLCRKHHLEVHDKVAY